METAALPKRVRRFGLFQLDLGDGKLLRKGTHVRLQEQSMRALCRLLETPGEVVSREDLQRAIWPNGTFVEFETNLNSVLKRLRAALGDDAENPVFIETLPKRGYRFIAPIEKRDEEPHGYGNDGDGQNEESTPSGREAPATSENKLPQTRLVSRSRVLWVSGFVLANAIAYALLLRPYPPMVVGIRHLSDLRASTQKIVTDGPRIYLSGRYSFGEPFLVFSSKGGQGEPFNVELPGAEAIWDISPDGSSLLVTTGQSNPFPVWKVPLPTGSPQRLGVASGTDACWSPDGRKVAYVQGSDLYVIGSGGETPRKVASFGGQLLHPVWSPDGAHVRLTVAPTDEHNAAMREALWEIDVRTGAAAPVLSAWNSSATHAVGWTQSGSYFLFTSARGGISDLWAQPQENRWFKAVNQDPVRLTYGPISFAFPILARDGKTIFSVGEQRRAELMRYDDKARTFSPFIQGISADQVAFTTDGLWIAYVSYPDGSLWRSKIDGTDSLQLTFPPMSTFMPSWSPDGKQIVFHATDAQGRMKGFLVDRNGSSLKPLLPNSNTSEGDFSWSVDGTSLHYVQMTGPITPSPRVRSLDLRSARSADVPGLSGCFAAQWSPDGRYIATLGWPSKQLSVLDTQTEKWIQVTRSADFPFWTADDRYLYFNTLNEFPLTSANGFFRFSVRDRRVERVLELPEFPLTGIWGNWAGIAPDGSPLVLKDDDVRAIYAIGIDFH